MTYLESNLLIEEILSTTRTLADLDGDGFDEPLHLRDELRQRRHQLLERLKATTPEGAVVSEIDLPHTPHQPKKAIKRSRRRLSSRRVA